jgi:hypothetical protein
LNTFRPPEETSLEGFRVTLRQFEARLAKLEAQLIQMDGTDTSVTDYWKYDYVNDARPPSPKQIQAFKDFFGKEPPANMPKGHVSVAIRLHYHPEEEGKAAPGVIKDIRSVIGEETGW